MACWGGIEMANGIGNVIESKSRLRLLAGKESAIESTPPQLSSPGEPTPITKPSDAFRLPLPVSVTEGTTKELNEHTGN
jgi:hypothetical protein